MRAHVKNTPSCTLRWPLFFLCAHRLIHSKRSKFKIGGSEVLERDIDLELFRACQAWLLLPWNRWGAVKKSTPSGFEIITYCALNEAGSDRRNCFIKATYSGKIEIMRFLNLKNPDLKKYRDDNQETAFSLACWNSNFKRVIFMVNRASLCTIQHNTTVLENCVL